MWRLWYGSAASWLVALVFAVGTVVSVLLMQMPVEVGLVSFFVLTVAQVAILWQLARTRFVRPVGPDRAPASL